MQYAKFTASQFEVKTLDPKKVQFFQGQGQIEKITKHNGHGEEDKYVYSVKPKFVEWSEGDTEVSVPVSKSITNFSKSMTPSQEMRWWIYKRWENSGSLGDPDAYYRKVMAELNQNQKDLAQEER